MTATERLRALLDERGAEWKGGRNHANYTSWDASDWRMSAEELADGTLFMRAYSVKHLSPEQAVAATLGRGTCEVEGFDDGMDEGMDGEWFALAPATWFLSCDHEVYGSERPHYCPVCGRKVEI